MSETWIELVTSIVAGSGVVAFSIRLLAKRITEIGNKHIEALEKNTEAVKENTLVQAAKGAVVVPLLALMLFIAGCGSTDPLIIRALERNEEIWREDRREDLDPEVVESREKEFAAQQRYARGEK